jgi:pilus assembly protein CpaB
MVLRIFLGLLLCVGLAALGTIGWLATHGSAHQMQAAASQAPKPVQVIVSSAQLHAGSLLRPTDLQSHPFPPDALVAGAIVDTPDARNHLVGALLRISIPAGGVVLPSDVVVPGDHGYLAAVLTPGMRAISVGVDAISGNAGLIWPGDHVDLILTQSLDDAAVPLGHRMVAETVVTNMRVIATDQDLVRGELPSSNGVGSRTITLEASQAQAERVSIASRMGRLSLALCALDGTEAAPPAQAVWSGDVSPALAMGDHGGKPDDAVHLYDGTGDAKEFHF